MSTRKQKGEYDGKIAGLYDLEDTIGRGHFAVVKLARHVFTGEKVAVKVIDKTKLDDISKAHLFQEVRCMKLVQHPNVVRLYEVIDTQTKLYLILEFGDGGDMYDYIMKHVGGLEESTARRYFRQIVEAISYCHKLHVVHRDLKPENVVFFEKLGLVKLTDFGFSNMFNPGKNLETSCGSLAYSAPEILLGDSYDAPAVDVWSLGVILYMLVCGKPPFQEANDSETLTMIMDCKYQVPSCVSRQCQDLICLMLIRDPSKRASLEHIMHHQWLTAGEFIPLTYMPLISREHVSDEDHGYVVQRMVEGKIASKDEIQHSVEKGSYDHIAATYYLLAERRLKKHQQQELQHAAAVQQQARKQSAPPGSRGKPHLEPLSLSPRVQTSSTDQREVLKPTYVQSLVSPPGTHPSPSTSPKRQPSPTDKHYRVRKCSLIKEESVEENQGDVEDMEVDLKPVKSCESIEDKCSNKQSCSPVQDPLSVRWPLKSVCSSPQLLNQILEENDSEDDDDFVPQKLHAPHPFHTHASMASPEILRKYEQRKKRRGAGQRGTSCSSSDASDTDDTEGRSRKDKLKHKFVHRRDSSDHSSDTDGPSGHSGGNMGGGARFSGGGGSSRSSRDSGNRKDSGKKDGSGSRGSKGHGNQGSKQHQANTHTGAELNAKSLTKKLSQLSVNSVSSGSSVGSTSSHTSSKSTHGQNGHIGNGHWTVGGTSVQYLGHTDSESITEFEAKSLQFSELSECPDRMVDESLSLCSTDCILMQRRGHRPSRKLATDINSNGLPPSFCKPDASQQLSVLKVESKCCSVV